MHMLLCNMRVKDRMYENYAHLWVIYALPFSSLNITLFFFFFNIFSFCFNF